MTDQHSSTGSEGVPWLTLADLITMIDMVENHTDAIDLADKIWPMISAGASAVNSHDALVKALERLLAAFKGLQPFPLVVQAVAEGLIKEAETALAHSAGER